MAGGEEDKETRYTPDEILTCILSLEVVLQVSRL